MSNTASVAEAVISSAVGVVFVIIARLVDRFLPDPKGEHPIPPSPELPTGRHEQKET